GPAEPKGPRGLAPRAGAVLGARHQLQPHAPREAAPNPPIPRARPEPQAVLDGLHALGEGTEAAPAVHQDRRPEARRGLRDALRVAGQEAVPPRRTNGGPAVKRVGVDIEKLRVALRRMSRGNLLMIAERAIKIVPRAKLG